MEVKKIISVEEKQRLELVRKRWFYLLLVLTILGVGYLVYQILSTSL